MEKRTDHRNRGIALGDIPTLSQKEAEQELLATLLRDATLPVHLAENLMEDLSMQLAADDFREDAHQRVYEIMLDLAGRGLRPDATLVESELRKKRGYSPDDMTPLLIGMEHANIHDYQRLQALIESIREASSRRKILQVFAELSQRVISPDHTPADVLLEAEKALAKTKTTYIGADNTVEAMTDAYRRKLQEWRAAPFELRGTTTGLKGIDRMTNGVKRADLWVVGSRMSMGKTAFAVSLAVAAARSNKGLVGIVSLEMAGQALMHRLASMVSGVAAEAIEAGDPAVDWDRVEDALLELAQLPLRIIDAQGATNRMNGARGKMTPEEIRRHVVAWHREQPLSLLLIDYLEIVKPPLGAERESRDIQLGLIAQAFKDLATELNIPVVLLAQTNRDGEKTNSKVPTLAGLRYSDEIGAIADVVVFPVRWDYYRERGEQLPKEVVDRPKGVTDVVIAKNRNGKVGTVPIFYAGHLFRFYDWDEQRACPVNYKGEPLRGLLSAPLPKELQPR